MFAPMVEVVPPGTDGNVCIKHKEVTRTDIVLEMLRSSRTQPGRFCMMFVDGRIMMSDTRDEQLSNLNIVRRARGDVLITGLGIGMILVPILRSSNVTSVTVVEHNRGVIRLVEPPVRQYLGLTPVDPRLNVQVGDAFTWHPGGARYDVIYHDIWPTITGDNAPEMTRLKRRYCHWLRPGGIQMCWQEKYVRTLNRKDRERYGG